MDDKELREIEARYAAYYQSNKPCSKQYQQAQNDISALLALVEQQQKELAALREAKQCTYKQEDYDSDIWQCSGCGAEWVFIEGNPFDNDMIYCPACAAKVTAISVREYDEEGGEIDKIIVRLPEAPEGGEG